MSWWETANRLTNRHFSCLWLICCIIHLTFPLFIREFLTGFQMLSWKWAEKCPKSNKTYCKVYPLSSLYGWIADLAHEEDAPGRVLQDEDQEGSVKCYGVWQTHGHDLNGGGGCRFCSSFIHTQHSLVGHLWRKQGEEVSISFFLGHISQKAVDNKREWGRIAGPTFETLSLTSSDIPEKSALSAKASVIPNSLSVSPREASAEIENLGRNKSTDLRNTEHRQCQKHWSTRLEQY